ncbi:MAG: hypothetical protein AB1515_06965 [Nitrospirota bacterium]
MTVRSAMAVFALALTAWAVGSAADVPVPPTPAELQLNQFGNAPIVPELAVDGVAVVGGEIVATMAVMAREPMADVQIQLELPGGVERTAGELSWSGPLAAGEVRIVEISAKLLAPGRRQIVGRVKVPKGDAEPTVLTTDRWLDIAPNAPPAKPRKK